MFKMDFLVMITVLLTLVIRFIYTLSFMHLHILDLQIYTHLHTHTPLHPHKYTKGLTKLYLYKPLLSIPIKYQQADKFYLGEIHLIRIIL